MAHPLTAPARERVSPLDDVLNARRSVREFSSAPPQMDAMAELLARACGQEGARRRSPSGGACYPIEAWVAIAAGNELAPGIYMYDRVRHALLELPGSAEAAGTIISSAKAAARASGCAHHCACRRLRAHPRLNYDSIAYSLVLKDAGAELQTLQLVATDMGLASCPIGAGNSELFARTIGAGFFECTSVAELLVGLRGGVRRVIDTRVAVVVAPWASASRPSLGAGIIQASAEALGASCRTHYANVHFATVFGMDAFEAVAGDTQLFPLGEHFFAVDVFGTERLDSDRFLRRFVRGPHTPENARVTFEWDTLTVLRDMIVPAWLDEWTDRILRDDPAVVGFSCVFNQVLPSLALARRIKALRPDIATVFGGACVHGIMGRAWSAAFPQFIDHVFLGEADVVFPKWLAAHAAGGARSALPGVTVQGVTADEPVLVAALDAIPTPQFADYFAMRSELAAKGLSAGLVNAIPFESSRGCWWGAKQHCTFCGLNNEGIAFRRKSASRVVAEVGELIDRHGERRFAAADNILSHDAVTELLPPLTLHDGPWRKILLRDQGQRPARCRGRNA